MKILMASDYAVPRGGAETLIHDLRSELSRRGHDVRLLSTDIGHDEGENFADYRCTGSERMARTVLQTCNPSAVMQLRRVLQEFQPDVVHVRMFLTQLSPFIMPLLRDRPSLYHLAWYRAICPTGLKRLPDGRQCSQSWGAPCLRHRCVPVQDWPLRMLQLQLFRRWLPAFDVVVANSRFVAKTMSSEGISTQVVHNGILVPNSFGSADEGSDKAPTILFAGRLAPEKGCRNLISAFALVHDRLPSAKLVIAGAGVEREHLEAEISGSLFARNVRFTGHLSPAQLAHETRRAWVQVIPSLWNEPFGIAALDAMMHARPVVAAAAGGLTEIVDDKVTGYLIDPNSTQDLAGSLLALLTNRKLTSAMGLAARERAVSHFSIGRCADEFERIYLQIVRERRPS